MWGTTSQTRRVLPQLLRNGDVRMVRAKNGVEPTHTTGDRLWEITNSEALATVQRAYASDVTTTELSGPYLAEFPSRPCFPLLLWFPLLGPPSLVHRGALQKLHEELASYADGVTTDMIVLRSDVESGACALRVHFPGWIVHEVVALQLQAYALAWLRHAFPTLFSSEDVLRETMFRDAVPLAGCAAMRVCPECRRHASRMEMCTHCGMTGWQMVPRTCMTAWHTLTSAQTWTDAAPGNTFTSPTVRATRQQPCRAFMCLPHNMPPLPLWGCRCGTKHLLTTAHCDICRGKRGSGARLRWDSSSGMVKCAALRGEPLSSHGEAGEVTALHLLASAFQDLLWMVSGMFHHRQGRKQLHMWAKCTMGPTWKVGAGRQVRYTIVLQGLGSASHPPRVTHPGSPMLLVVTPDGAWLECSAPGCNYKTSACPLHHVLKDELFPLKGHVRQISINPRHVQCRTHRIAYFQHRATMTSARRPDEAGDDVLMA